MKKKKNKAKNTNKWELIFIGITSTVVSGIILAMLMGIPKIPTYGKNLFNIINEQSILKKEINTRTSIVQNYAAYCNSNKNINGINDTWTNKDSVDTKYSIMNTNLFYNNPKAINYRDSSGYNEKYKNKSYTDLLLKLKKKGTNNLDVLKEIKKYSDVHKLADIGSYDSLFVLIKKLEIIK